VHEYAHAAARRLPLAEGFATYSDGMARRIQDRAYLDRRYYLDLTPSEAMDNASSYASLVQDLGTGTAVTQLPSERAVDTMTGCGPGQQEVIRQSLSQIQRWNDAAEYMVDVSEAEFSYYGGRVTRAIENAFEAPRPTRARLKTIYQTAGIPLLMGMQLECDGDRGSCASGITLLWQTGTRGVIHVCPKWIAHADPLVRNRTLYGALLSNVGLRGVNPWHYVDLARALEGIHFATPEPPPPLPNEPFPQSTVPGTAIG
jgi:hypothetical protein